MDIRRTLQGKPVAGIGAAVFMVLIAGVLLARQFWPEKKANVTQAFWSDDDGKTWYSDSAYLVPPIDHNGKPAVFAVIYNYDGGSKQFCAYLEKYSPESKKHLEASIAEAVNDGKKPSAAALFQDHTFMQNAVMVKSPGAPESTWIYQTDPSVLNVISVRSPDGSAIDQVFVY